MNVVPSTRTPGRTPGEPSSATERAIERLRRECGDAVRAAGVGLSPAGARAVRPGAASGVEPAAFRLALSVPGAAATAETILADALLGDLSAAELQRLSESLESLQDARSGGWRDGSGRPDVSTTALAWWALRRAGRPEQAPHLTAAARLVRELGGIQRTDFVTRLWLALAGAVPWSWLPAIPSELWLLPTTSALSPARTSPWARAILVAYHLVHRARTRVCLPDARPLILEDARGRPVDLRLTAPGLAGDLLQVFDQAIKLSRKLPRQLVDRRAAAAALALLERGQQRHGGWFSARPTLLSLVAMRASGATSDDPRVRKGLEYLRQARRLDGHGRLVQAELSQPTGECALLHAIASGDLGKLAWLRGEVVQAGGAWQARADSAGGGWPIEVGASDYLDTWATGLVIEALRHARARGERTSSAGHASEVMSPWWGPQRRAADVLLAMQEPDGSFARFERGESAVPLSSMPWRDAERLSLAAPDLEARVVASASALRSLAHLGWRDDDDRVRRGWGFVEAHARRDARTWQTATLARVAKATADVSSRGDGSLRAWVEDLLRRRQDEDGGFDEDPWTTALALSAMVELGGPCVQSQRAARSLLRTIDARPPGLLRARRGAVLPEIGAGAGADDPLAATREACAALQQFHLAGGTV